MCSHLFINWLRNKTRWTPYIYHFLGEITICPLERQIYTLIYKGLRWYYTNKQCSLMNKIFISNELYARVKKWVAKIFFSFMTPFLFSEGEGFVYFPLSSMCLSQTSYLWYYFLISLPVTSLFATHFHQNVFLFLSICKHFLPSCYV